MAKDTVYITGHKNPDTDSIVSAISYAYLKQSLGMDALAVRIGEINPETEYVLNMFNTECPPLVSSVVSKVRDIEFDEVVTCKNYDNFDTAIKIMRSNKKKVIAVVDDNDNLLGVATLSDITNPMMPSDDRNNKLIRETEIEDIVQFIEGEMVFKAKRNHTDGHVYIVASKFDSKCKDKIVITSNDEQLHLSAINNGAAILISTNTALFTDKVIGNAKENDCTLILCNKSIHEISKEIYFATKMEKIMTTDIQTFNYNDNIDDVASIMNKSRYRSYPIIDQNNRVVGMISRYHLFRAQQRNLILVDHNEFDQSVFGAQDANILEIIDHHRLGGIKTNKPIYIRTEVIGCCSTIIAKLFEENDVEIPKDIAGLLCCAIISDTINFKSVTCTKKDIDMAKQLAKIADINLEELGPKVLTAGVNINNKNCDQIFRKDLKQFIVNKSKITIGQCSIVSFDSIKDIKEKMEILLAKYAFDSDSKLTVMAFSLIDGSGSYLLFKGESSTRFMNNLNVNYRIEDGFVFLDNVISRKQQIIPIITDALS